MQTPSPSTALAAGAEHQRQAVGMLAELDSIDRKLLNRLQDGLDIVEEPFKELAHDYASPSLSCCIVSRLCLESGLLSRFGPMFDADRMGGKFCLCAMKVPVARYEEVTEIVNAHAEVAHNYKRDHKLNMWFVIGVDQVEAIESVAKTIEEETRLDVLLFPKEKEFFISLKIQVPE